MPAYSPAALVIDRQQRSVLLDGRPVVLGGRAFDVLAALTARPGQVCSVQALHQAVWPDVPVDPNNLRVQIATLRQRFSPQHIDNVVRRGYRWVGPVHEAGSAPASVTLIGRSDELQALQAMAVQHRLVNVVGAGGIGKTCLVRAWRASLAPRTQVVGAVVVDMAPLAQADALRLAVAEALAPVFDAISPPAPPVPATTELPALVAALASATAPHALAPAALLPHLVLDNAEHLIDATAQLVQMLLDGLPRLHIVVTSQIPLRLPGEQLLRLGPLELPERSVTLGQARALGALVLFAERVRALDPHFELTAGNLATVADICCRLDGLPLAIELAAARVPALGLQALHRGLSERLGLLSGGPGHAPARQRTLRAALDWSYGLLDVPTQQVFCRLGTFAGPFTLAQAQRALAPSHAEFPAWSIVDAIHRLVDVSMLSHDGGDPPRYRLLELPRAFALERLGLPRHSPTVEETPPLAVSPLLQRLVRLVSAGEAGHAGHAGNATRDGSALDPQAVLALALRLQPDDLRQFDTAVVELQRAVELAASVVADSDDDGAGGDTDHVLQAVAEQTRLGQLDRGAEELYTALVELQRRDERRRAAMQRSQRALLDACVRQDLLRRDAPAVARHIETLAALNGTARPSWTADYIEHETRYLDDGMRLGHRLHLQVGVALARRRLETATDPAERLAVQPAGARLARTGQPRKYPRHAAGRRAIGAASAAGHRPERCAAGLGSVAAQPGRPAAHLELPHR